MYVSIYLYIYIKLATVSMIISVASFEMIIFVTFLRFFFIKKSFNFCYLIILFFFKIYFIYLFICQSETIII